MTTLLAKLIGNDEAAQLLHITPGTLRFWRCKGKGPRFVKFGPSKSSGVAYDPDDIEAWKAARRFQSTTAHSEAVRLAALSAVHSARPNAPSTPVTPPWLQPNV